MTDGVDGGSKKASLKQNLRDAEEANVVIYTVQYNTLPQLPARLSQIINLKAERHVRTRMMKEYGVGSTYLQSLAEKTGGRIYRAEISLTCLKCSAPSLTNSAGNIVLATIRKAQASPAKDAISKCRTRSRTCSARARKLRCHCQGFRPTVDKIEVSQDRAIAATLR